MKIGFRFFCTGLLLLAVLTSCQQVFTTSAYFWYEADISTMTNDQKLSYAEDLLTSGTATAAELEAAYNEIAAMLPDDLSTADPDMVLLAADLAVGASGLGDAVSGALDAFASGETEDLTTGLLDDIDTDNLEDAVALIEAAEDMDGVVLTPEQYTNAAAAQLLIVINDAGGVDQLGTVDPEDPDLVQAQYWADQGGVDLSTIFGDLTIPE